MKFVLSAATLLLVHTNLHFPTLPSPLRPQYKYIMLLQRRPAVPALFSGKQNTRGTRQSLQRRPSHTRYHSQMHKSSPNVRIIQVQNFLQDDSVLQSLLPFTKRPVQLPIFQQMPSIDLISVDSCIQTPRGYEQFTKDAHLSQSKLTHYFDSLKFIRANCLLCSPIPKIDWKRQRNRNRTQVVRQNCTNGEYHRLLQQPRRRLKEFVDDVFRSSNASLGKGACQADWKRKFWTKEDGFPYAVVVQGMFRTENLVSCFVALPIYFQVCLFQEQDFAEKGAFFVKLHKEGIWRYIVVDNVMPYARGISMLSEGFGLTLIEKVWAKHLGQYSSLDQLENTKLGDILTDLTGAPSQQFKSTHPKLLFILKIMLRRKCILLASNQNNVEKRMKMTKLGIPQSYSYPVVGIIGDEIIMKNEWGALRTSEYFGMTEIRMGVGEFRNYFDWVIVNKAMEDGCHHSLSLRQKKGLYSLIRLSPEQDCTAYLTLFQIHTLNPKQQYCCCRLILFQVCHSSVLYLQQQESTDKKTTLEAELSKDSEYLLVVCVDWADKEHETVLSVYSGQPVDLAKLKFSEENNYLLTLKKQKTSSQKVKGVVGEVVGDGRGSKSQRRERR